LKKIVLLLGGARSGKSHYAQEMAKNMAERVLFVATAEAGDEDMRHRIENHQRSRPAAWRTLEATTGIGDRIEDEIQDEQLVIVDCITLLINNIFCHYDQKQFEVIEDSIIEKEVVAEVNELLKCIQKVDASFIIISNEVGLGIVPDNRMGRLYRDFLGRVNQMLAQAATEVYFMMAGIPLRVKV
jgi:adenosylcobinamide kinase / adenosylcobinamide-phosphate guanylyltransferase